MGRILVWKKFAIFHNKPLIVKDIFSDPDGKTVRNFALQYGFKSYGAWPIFGKNHKILGALTLYFRYSHLPTPTESQFCEIFTRLAGVAIENRAYEEKIRHLAG